jgi:DNA-binding NarL/FixJ family response regulator
MDRKGEPCPVALDAALLIVGHAQAAPAWCRYCARHACPVFHVEDGRAALEVRRGLVPLAIIIASAIRDLPLQEFCDAVRLHAAARHVPIVVSGLVGDADARRALAAGVDGYVLECQHPSVLEEDVARWMGIAFAVHQAFGARRQAEPYTGPRRRRADVNEPHGS